MTALQEFHYRTLRPAAGHFPGAHRSSRGETGFEFRGHLPLQDAPDARRIDLRASLRDPHEQWLVRVHSQRMTVPVYLIADLSASMAFEGARRKLDVLGDFARALAYSAARHGDAFGFVGCDRGIREDLLLPLTRARGAGLDLGDRLRRLADRGGLDAARAHGAQGLALAHRHLRRTRALVFLASDFHFGAALLERVLDSLAMHEVVPVVIRDEAEYALPDGGALGHALAWARDPETGERRLLWSRPALRARWADLQARSRAHLQAQLREHRLRPLFLEQGFRAEAVTAYFVSG
ncbi:DUF58 domain-containing protein [Caldimonas sp. KR1-144]|uniref:DUF58 domain-containing protein n=1 Tax=Caldimonas sp. KR1-144 TaxID=3400911 RepID=UPI003C0B3848